MDRFHTAFGGIERSADFWHHAARNGSVSKQCVNLTGAEIGQQVACFVQNTTDIGQHQQFFGLEHYG